MGKVSARRSLLLVAAAALAVSACSDSSTGPGDPIRSAPVVQLSHLGGVPADDDLCGGFSPCDAYFGSGAPGMCFLPPMVDNHLSEAACAGDLIPGLDGLFKLAWCKVTYPDGPSQPPVIDYSGPSAGCQPASEWQDLKEGSDNFYSASVRWRRNEADPGDIFRLYVVHGEHHFAHRDVIIDPNDTRPADDYLHAIGYGNEPVKVSITDAFACLRDEGSDSGATCLIAGDTDVPLSTGSYVTNFHFNEGNPAFFADFSLSECLQLRALDASGNRTVVPAVDTPLADCLISLSSEDLDTLEVPGLITVTLADTRWTDASGPFYSARLNVLQVDPSGVTALPPTASTASPPWLGQLTASNSGILRAIGSGLVKLASLFRPEPLYAAFGAGWDLRRLSDFQVSVQPVYRPDATDCPEVAATCDLGTFSGLDPVPVTVQVEAPDDASQHVYPAGHFPVPHTRLHFLPEDGSVACAAGSEGPLDAYGSGCYGPTDADASTDEGIAWGHVVVVTGGDGLGTALWTLADGNNRLNVVACGVARPGDSWATSPSGGVYGNLGDNCSARSASATGYDSGPEGFFTPFEPIDTDSEVALYGLPLTFEARTCPTIDIDGIKSADEWDACATPTVFTAPLKGPKVEDNGTLYTYSDGDALYIGVEVRGTTELGNRIFVNLTESVSGGEGVEAAGDELLVIDQFETPGGVPSDWHFTASCVGNNSSSLCGDPDTSDDGGANFVGHARVAPGGGSVFYELKRPLGSPNAGPSGKEDLAAGYGAEIGLRVQVTQGRGGGKGGFVYPDPQTDPTKYRVITIE